MRTSCLLAAGVTGGVAGSTNVARAEPEVMAPTEARSARLAGHIYLNAASGERTVTPGAVARMGYLYWWNDDYGGSCEKFLALDDPGRDEIATGRAKFGSAVTHWGDVPVGILTDGFGVAYATDIGCDWKGEGVAGLDAGMIFHAGYDGELDPGGLSAVDVAAFVIEDIAGSADCTLGATLFSV